MQASPGLAIEIYYDDEWWGGKIRTVSTSGVCEVQFDIDGSKLKIQPDDVPELLRSGNMSVSLPKGPKSAKKVTPKKRKAASPPEVSNGSDGDVSKEGEAEAQRLGRSQKEALTRAEAVVDRLVSEHASSSSSGSSSPAKKKPIVGKSKKGKQQLGFVPTTDQVLEVLLAIGGAKDWPTQKRDNVTDSGKPVPGMCLGLVFALGGGGAKASQVSEMFPRLGQFVVTWCGANLPKTRDGNDFPFSSLQINFNYAAKKHVDGNNIGPSYIMSIGDHTGGNLWTADQGVLSCRNQWKLFDGNQEHATLPFKGTRISFIAFTHGLYNKVCPFVKKQLLAMGFNAARTDGKDIPFFERFRIEKSYLTDKHNDAFRKFREQRLGKGKSGEGPSGECGQGGAMPAPSHAGAVAVECYGRQAERGGGWVSFVGGDDAGGGGGGGKRKKAGGKKAELVELRPNSTGVWVTELELLQPSAASASASMSTWAEASGIRLRQHEQFNLYKDLTGETKRLSSYISSLPKGRIIVVSIADTACAKSRPIGAKVYEALRKVGAAADMPAIEYRQAWALLGYKGAPEGAAVQSMGMRSTLLRLEATFAFKCDAAGNTKKVGAWSEKQVAIKNSKEDLTSIIDVVTGGGQDCAV